MTEDEALAKFSFTDEEVRLVETIASFNEKKLLAIACGLLVKQMRVADATKPSS